MKSESISSPQNPLLKSVRKAIARGGLTDEGLAVAEGFHLLAEALRTGSAVEMVIASESSVERVDAGGGRVVTVSDAAFAQTASTETPQGVMALVRPRKWTIAEVLSGETLLAVLDGIQEPGNAGAILRAAEAFGATGAVFLKGTVNGWNPKAMRASAGSVFRLPWISGLDAAALLAALDEGKIELYAAQPEGGVDVADTDLRGRCALVIGSEGRGVSGDVARHARPVRIPTIKVESLNAAVAAGVLFYEARRQRTRRV